MSDRRRSQGYTLIEVLVGFMILALSLTVLLRIFSGGVRNLSLSAQYSHAVLIAESELAAANTPGTLVPGTTAGITGDAFRWTRTVSEYQPADQLLPGAITLPAYQVDVTVEWDRAGKTRSVSLTGLRLGAAEGGRI